MKGGFLLLEYKKIWVLGGIFRNLGIYLYSNLGSLEMTGIQAMKIIQCLCFVSKRKMKKTSAKRGQQLYPMLS